jgi:bacterioferritin (cytochrome b1)
MLEGILAVEEEHADELSDLLESFPLESKTAPVQGKQFSKAV